jgi:hypothetical protein
MSLYLTWDPLERHTCLCLREHSGFFVEQLQYYNSKFRKVSGHNYNPVKRLRALIRWMGREDVKNLVPEHILKVKP